MDAVNQSQPFQMSGGYGRAQSALGHTGNAAERHVHISEKQEVKEQRLRPSRFHAATFKHSPRTRCSGASQSKLSLLG
eukprot:357663-Chlamydomonas_euryale.AAC.19